MLPTTAGVVAMPTLPTISPKNATAVYLPPIASIHTGRRSVAYAHPASPATGQATAYRHLEDARAELSVIRQDTLRVRA